MEEDEIEDEIAEEATTGLTETATGTGTAGTKLMEYRCGIPQEQKLARLEQGYEIRTSDKRNSPTYPEM